MLEEWSEILLVEGNPSDVDLALHASRSPQIVTPIEGVRDGGEAGNSFTNVPSPGDKGCLARAIYSSLLHMTEFR
jgi:hypothetical protein